MIHRAFRWVQFFSDVEEIRCPSGHKMDFRALFEADKDLICQHKGSNGRENCARRLFLIGGYMRLRAQTRVMVCEVSASELKYLEEAGLDFDGQLRYLGLAPDSHGRAA